MPTLDTKAIIVNARNLARAPSATAGDLKAALKGLLNVLEARESSPMVWSDKERQAIDALMQKQELSEHQVIRMGIKWYQIIVLMSEEGYPTVRFQTRTGELRPIGPVGCGGTD